MQEEFRLFLVENSSNEVHDLIMSAFEILDNMYPVDIHNKFLDLVMTEEDNDGNTLTYIINLVTHYLKQILINHELIVSDDIDLTRLINIVNALLDIQDYEDTDVILDILHLEIDNEEKIAEILSLVCPMDQSELLLEIESVSESLLSKLKEFVVRDSVVISDVVNLPADKYIAEIKLFEEFSKNDNLICAGMLKSNVLPGYAFSVYANIIGSDLEAIPIDQAAQELVAMALISSDGHSNPKLVINKNIEQYVSDMRKITQIDIKVTNILLDYQYFKDQKNTAPREVG